MPAEGTIRHEDTNVLTLSTGHGSREERVDTGGRGASEALAALILVTVGEVRFRLLSHDELVIAERELDAVLPDQEEAQHFDLRRRVEIVGRDGEIQTEVRLRLPAE